MKVNEIWLANGLWENEKPSKVKIIEILGDNIDVEYLDETGCRILPKQCLIGRVENDGEEIPKG